MSKKAVSKEIINISTSITTQDELLLFPSSGGVTFPCVVSGLRVIGTVSVDDPAELAVPFEHWWCIMIFREGEETPAPAISWTNGTTTMTPQEDILIWGGGAAIGNNMSRQHCYKNYEVVGTTKRKLRIGDSLWFVAESNSATDNYELSVQFFVTV